MAHLGSRKLLILPSFFFILSLSLCVSLYLSLVPLALTSLVDILGPELSVARAPKHWNPNSQGR